MADSAERQDHDLQRGFVLGDWTVRPLAGLLQRHGHDLHLEPKVMDVLVCLARHQGDVVTRDMLLAEVWGKVIVTDDAITRCVSDLRTLLGDTGRDRSYIRTIPRRGYSLLIPVTPLFGAEGTAAPTAANGSMNGADRAGRVNGAMTPAAEPHAQALRFRTAIYLAAAGLGAVLITLFVASKEPVTTDLGSASAAVAPSKAAVNAAQPPAPAGAERIGSVAVLPFVNLSGDPKHGYFSDGLSEDIRYALLSATDLRVAARTSSEVFRNKAIDVREIAAQLNVDALLEGTVRITEDRLRITSQLTNARDGYAVWAASFERGPDDRMQLQTEVAEEIVRKLAPTLADPAKALKSATANVEARDYYQLGRHHWHLRTEESSEQAVAYFRQAIALDPDYALAYSGLADALVFSALYGKRSLEEVSGQARAAIDEALRLDPDLAETHASLGLLLKTAGDLDGALVAHQRAIELKPQYSMAQMWLGIVLGNKRDVKRAHEHYAEALKVDPLHPIVQANYVDSLMNLGRYDEAFAALDRFMRFNPDDMLLKAQVSGLLAQGRYDEVLAFSVGHSFTEKYRPYASAPVIAALIELQRFDDAERMISDNGDAMEPWLRVWLQARLATARRDAPGLEQVVVNLLSLEGRAFRDELERRCVAGFGAYLRGTAAFIGADYHTADARFDEFERRRVADRCYDFPLDYEIAALLYRALSRAQWDAAGGEELAARTAQRIEEARQLSWDTPELAVLTVAVHFMRGDRGGTEAALQNILGHGWQPLGYMRAAPLFDRLLDSDEYSGHWAVLKRSYEEVQGRSSTVALAKLGL